MSPLVAKANGSLDTSFDVDAVNGPALAKTVAADAHAAGRKALLMLGGAGNGSAIRAAVTNNETVFVANLVSTMNALGYDGIDLDWEDSVDWGKFQTLVHDLRAALPNAILTLPGGALNLNYETVDPHIPAIAKMLDRFNIQSYDGGTVWSGGGWNSWFDSAIAGETPSTPVDIGSSLQRYIAAGIPKQKLGMGIGFAAICYTNGVTGPRQPTASNTLFDNDNWFTLGQLYGTDGPFAQRYRHWDQTAYEPYLSLPVPDGHGCRFVSMEDEQSIAAKGAYSRKNGFGGIIIWTLGEGYVGTHPAPNFLLDSVGKAFLDPSASETVAVSIMQGNAWAHTNGKLTFDALVTGTTNKAVTWSIVEPNCGTVDTSGRYVAPNSPGSCHLTATSTADTSKTATIAVSITNSVWAPALTVVRYGTDWTSITAEDTSVSSVSVKLPGTNCGTFGASVSDTVTCPTPPSGNQAGTNYPVYAGNISFPLAGGNYTFLVRSSGNRLATETVSVPVCNPDSQGVCQ
jgi:chitinase